MGPCHSMVLCYFRCFFFSCSVFVLFFCIWLQPLFNRVPWIFLFPLFVKSNLLFGYQNKFASNHNVINNICFHIKQKLDNWPKLKIVVEFLFNMKNWIKMVDKLEKENSFWWQIGAGLSTRFYWIIYEVKAKKQQPSDCHHLPPNLFLDWIIDREKKTLLSRWYTKKPSSIGEQMVINSFGADLQLKFITWKTRQLKSHYQKRKRPWI